jgi:hypothetical protein
MCRTMRSRCSCLGGLLSLLYLLVTIDSFAPTCPPNSRFLCTHQKHHITPSFHRHSIHSTFSADPISAGLFKRVSASSPTKSFPNTSTLALSASSTISSFKSSNSFVLSALLLVSSCGLAIEEKTTVGKALSVSINNVEC